MNLVATLGLGALGVPVGSFLNVVIDRVPDRLALRGRVEGEVCAPKEIAGVPFQPWLLRAWRDDVDQLPRRWLWVEIVTAVAFAVIGARFGDDTTALPLLVLAASLVAVSVIDLRLLRIPDRVTFPTLAVSLPLLLLLAVADGEGSRFTGALLGAGVYFMVLFIPHLIYPRGMGFGDVKLALVMGLYLGWLGWTADYPVLGPIRFVLYALMLGCALGVVFGLASAAVKRRRGEFPFGPALALACVVVALYTPELRL